MIRQSDLRPVKRELLPRAVGQKRKLITATTGTLYDNMCANGSMWACAQAPHNIISRLPSAVVSSQTHRARLTP